MTAEPEWLPIPGWEDEYAINRAGQVLSLPRTVVRRTGSRYTVRCAHLLTPFPQRTSGALTVLLHRPGHRRRFTIHRLLQAVFGTEAAA
jgi:hypothetical protein